ncbi:MAG TPA: hypothetical protein VK689_21960 [Armatimonadota bacterium]|nr:hypothetical protein [Armatimonadota bacterium]
MLYVLMGCLAIRLFRQSPPKMMVINGNLANLALFCCIIHTLYVNTRFLPREFQPGPGKKW